MDASALSLGNRRNEDIALDLMKFVAMTTSYGRTSGAGGSVGFQGERRSPSRRSMPTICWSFTGSV